MFPRMNIHTRDECVCKGERSKWASPPPSLGPFIKMARSGMKLKRIATSTAVHFLSRSTALVSRNNAGIDKSQGGTCSKHTRNLGRPKLQDQDWWNEPDESEEDEDEARVTPMAERGHAT